MKTNQVSIRESRPRHFGKSTLVTNSFLAEAKAGKSVEYRHPDYVCMSKKRYKELLTQILEQMPCEEKRGVIGLGYTDMERENLRGRQMGYNVAMKEIKQYRDKVLKVLN